ncbi:MULTISPECIES: YbaK/EbsC family protein [Clostridium]|uniref:Cys-tRNA(Pro)/Cys-tRNA(Cys) deacylase YbaK n=2 Tax=Clostridium TaxID=1485 RepID=A0A166SQD9_9CLOT|nr:MULTISPECIES: YbaK/EbsC family protein [Clostridium]OAA92650.1 Cys-tRNA(Pro)/Cys-tRNA(Cys) deacylase YbaK [Clostridium coskatii]OBR94576.1 Cys-tRNA(Pro)/Cys-tRNA(Cys) deacylase YbaK [Clostridium coskatii]RMC96146.1 YbaK/EbsC family protein [Clostridium autoethanogenum]
MSVENVVNYFLEKGLENPVFKLESSGATVQEAAETIHTDPKYIAKTLAFKLKDEDILIVMRGDLRVSNKKFKKNFKIKAKMLDHDEVLQITGHPVGGLCPFGLKNNIKIYLDDSIKDFDYVYPAAGSKEYALKISPSEISELTKGEWIDVGE